MTSVKLQMEGMMIKWIISLLHLNPLAIYWREMLFALNLSFIRLSHKDNMSDFHLDNNKEEETCRPETALI